MLDIYVDADACPVKSEICKVAARYGLRVIFVSNTWMRIPMQDNVEMVVVDGNRKLDATDDYIADHAGHADIVITGDIPLTSRCIKKGARVVSPAGRVYNDSNIGDALATRNLMTGLREAGEITSGASSFGKQDRSRFLQSMDEIVQSVKRNC